MDRNGYNPSLFNTSEYECYACRREGITLVRHEVIHGANRQLAKKYGLWIYVCPRCHAEIHKEDNGKYRFLKEYAQRYFESEYPDKDFLAIFGRKYI